MSCSVAACYLLGALFIMLFLSTSNYVLSLFCVKKVGLVLDAGIEDELQIRQLQVADAARASLGLPVVEYIVTDTPLKVSSILLF